MHNHVDAGHDRPEVLLGKAMAVGRELAELLRSDCLGLLPHRNRMLAGTVERYAGDRSIMAPMFRGPLDGLIDLLARLIDEASVETVVPVVIGADKDGEIHAEHVVRDVAAEARPLLAARDLAVQLAGLIDRVADIVAADHAIIALISERAGR